MEKLTVAAIGLFLFSTLTCRKVPGVCAALAVAAASTLIAAAISEATAVVCDKVANAARESIEDDGEQNEFFVAPTNGKYGSEETGQEGEVEDGGRTFEVPTMRYDTEEHVEHGGFTDIAPLTYFL